MVKKTKNKKYLSGSEESPSPWQRTQERLKTIRKNLDKSDAAIGKMFGVTRAAIFELRMRYHIPKVRSNTQHRERVIQQVRKLPAGLTIAVAAEKLKLTEQRAYYYGKRAGYHFTRKKGKHERSDYWKARFKTLKPGLTLREVARVLGISYIYAIQLCQRHRYKVRWAGSSKPPRLPFRSPRAGH
jgi:transcriptional regulator with XRE-family HTH domain